MTRRGKKQFVGNYVLAVLRRDELFNGYTAEWRKARRSIIPRMTRQLRENPQYHPYFQNEPLFTKDNENLCGRFIFELFNDLKNWHSSFHKLIPDYEDLIEFLNAVRDIVLWRFHSEVYNR